MKRRHPDEVRDELKASTQSPRFFKNLEILHQVCREISGIVEKDYSQANIGRISQIRKGPSLNTLYSPKGHRFRKLIQAWAEWDRVEFKNPESKPNELKNDNELLAKIGEDAVRSFVGLVLADRRRLHAEVNSLKALSAGRPVIDLRNDGKAEEKSIIETIEPLSKDELETLRNVTSPFWLERHKLREGPRGELLEEGGSVILPRGALTGIRKICGGRLSSDK